MRKYQAFAKNNYHISIKWRNSYISKEEDQYMIDFKKWQCTELELLLITSSHRKEGGSIRLHHRPYQLECCWISEKISKDTLRQSISNFRDSSRVSILLWCDYMLLPLKDKTIEIYKTNNHSIRVITKIYNLLVFYDEECRNFLQFAALKQTILFLLVMIKKLSLTCER